MDWLYLKKARKKKQKEIFFGGETYGSRSTFETLFKEETDDQIKARKEVQALLKAEPNLSTFLIDPIGK